MKSRKLYLALLVGATLALASFFYACGSSLTPLTGGATGISVSSFVGTTS